MRVLVLRLGLGCVFLALASFPTMVNAQSSESSANTSEVLLADSTVDDSYDPFVDYSEFDEASEEEADIN